MGPVVEEILAALMSLRRVALLAILGFVALVLWAAARRGGRKGLELALLLVCAAAGAFFGAVFGPRPPLTDTVAIVLALLAAVLLVAAAGVLVWYGLRRRRPRRRVAGHTHAPWEKGGW